MIVPIDIARKHAQVGPYLELVSKRVKGIVWAYCEEEGYAFASRPKTIESISEKIETGRYRKWSDLEDLFACTIVIPTLAQEPQVLNFLKERFLEQRIRARGSAQKNPELFRFDSTRFIGKLKPPTRDTASELYSIQFEVQVRSAFEHAWCVTTHNLAYKGDDIEWRRLRLVAQLKAAVEQLDNLILGFDETAKYISEQYWPEVAAKKKIQGFFGMRFATHRLPAMVKPTSWMRFCDNFYSLLRSSSRNLNEITKNALEVLEVELNSLGHDKHPYSITLLQFSMGVLADQGLLGPKLTQYTPLITDQLVQWYPAVTAFDDSFDLEW